MSQATYTLNENRSAAVHAELVPLDAAPAKSTGTTHLNTALVTYASIEFVAVACSAYFIGLLYHGIFLNSWRTEPKYILAATFIAALVAFISIALHSFIAIRRQPRHIFLWRGMAAVMLAFPVFLSIIFISKLSSEYSRVDLHRPNNWRRSHSYLHARTFLFVAAVRDHGQSSRGPTCRPDRRCLTLFDIR